MTKYKRGQHPRSLANLGKPKTKAGRFNFTLSAQSAEWLSRQPNKSAAIDQLIEDRINAETGSTQKKQREPKGIRGQGGDST